MKSQVRILLRPLQGLTIGLLAAPSAPPPVQVALPSINVAGEDALPHPFAHALRRVLSEREPRRVRLPGVSPAGVLVALFEADGEVRVWLLRRPSGLRTHAGQVALPGGKKDPTDATIIETAL